MAHEIELSDYSTIEKPRRTNTYSSDTEESGGTPTKGRLLRIGCLTLGVLCIIQATLNISLRLAFYSKESTDQQPFNISIIADMCQIDQSPQNSTQSCSCCKNMLRRLVREYKALETERDVLQNKLIQMTRDKMREEDYFPESGSGTMEERLPDLCGYK